MFFLPSVFYAMCVHARRLLRGLRSLLTHLSLSLSRRKKRSPSSSSPPQPTASVVAEKVVVSSPSSFSLKFQRARPTTHIMYLIIQRRCCSPCSYTLARVYTSHTRKAEYKMRARRVLLVREQNVFVFSSSHVFMRWVSLLGCF